MTREQLQLNAVELLETNKRLVCQWATGTGKSNVALSFLKKHPESSCLIFVPEQNNIDNWIAEFIKFNISLTKVEIACYASIHKYENTSWDLIVFDEVPHIDTNRRRYFSESIKGTYVLALGAVIEDEEKFALQKNYGDFTFSTVSLREAIAWGILPSPTINICHIKLDTKAKVFWHSGKLYTEQELYDILAKEVQLASDEYNLRNNTYNKQKMFRAGTARKRFLGSRKESVVRTICNKLKEQNKRFICFCASIKQAESLGKENTFTSQTPKSENVLERFNAHEINSLFVVGKLIEGQNLVDIEHGIITQLGGTSRITVQEVGRVLRSKNPVIWIPVFDNTKDDYFLRTITNNIPSSYIKHYTI